MSNQYKQLIWIILKLRFFIDKENLKSKFREFEPFLEDIIFNLKDALKDAQANKVDF